MTKKSVLLTSWLCLPLLLISLPARLSREGVAVGMSLGANPASGPFSSTGCAKNPAMNTRVTGLALSAAAIPTPDGCSDPIDKCKKPIKYLGSKGLCACFACEYGQATQHNVCTQNKKDKETLLAESTPE